MTTVQLPRAVADLGILAGLLQDAGGGAVSLDTAWFSDPAAGLREAPTRLDRLVDLLTQLLGPGTPFAVDGFPDACWLHLPSFASPSPTPLCLVVPKDAPATGRIGLGGRVSVQSEGLTYDVFAYLPLVAYDPSGSRPVLTSPDDPCQIGLRVAAPAGAAFKVPKSGVTFSAVDIGTGIYLGAQAPTFTLRFEELAGTTEPAEYHTLRAFLQPQVEDWLSEAIVRASTWLGQPIGDYWTSPGDALVAATFLSKDDDGNYNFSLADIEGRPPTELALDLLFGLLYGFAGTDVPVPILRLPGGGVYITRREDAGGGLDYGVRLAVDLALGGETSESGATRPAVDIALGTWFEGETDEQNWMTEASGSPAQRGLSVFIVHWASGEVSLAPGFALTSVGFGVGGGGDAPLVDVDGVTLRGVELRASLESAAWDFGFAARVDGVGFPLGPGFSHAQGGGGSNPVVQTLVASDGSASAPANPVNPAFSAEAAYVKGHPPVFEILDPQGTRTDVIWFPIQRRLGPLECRKLGLRADLTSSDPVLGFIFDGGVSLAALDVELDQLSVGVHLARPADPSSYDVDLKGLAVTFSGGGVEISGGLLKTGTPPAVEYVGEAVIRFEDLAISAGGAFGSLPGGGTSLFIFAWLNAPLGGPPFLTVTGLSAGFGYNRSLKIPAQDAVQQFPLVAGLSNPAVAGGDPANPNAAPDPGKALTALESWVPVTRGEYWLAVGLQATSFEIVNLNALAIVEFGTDFVVAILGIATLKQPQAGRTYVYAELDVEVVLRPLAGEIQASAVLAPSSFVLDPAAHLTGGFAFAAWFADNANAGDWVLTLGGYHPAFTAPSYYPQEPRVGIDWRLSDTIAVSGDVYFAITPAAMMAGGGLAVTFASGSLKAWLKAQIDAIVRWKPFFFVADASISIGVSYHLQVLFVDTTISVELSAQLRLWGPPVGFRVHVDWYVISFTITHGEPSPPADPTWDDLERMLPAKTTEHPSWRPAARLPGAPALPASPATTSSPAYLSIAPAAGLVRKTQVGPLEHWLVRSEQVKLAITSALPATSIAVQGSDGTRTLPGAPVGVRIVDVDPSAYQSTQTVTIVALTSGDVAHIRACMPTDRPCAVRGAGCTDPELRLQNWELGAVNGALPKAIWGAPVPSGAQPPLDANGPTVTATVGVTLAPGSGDISDCTPQMKIAEVFEDRAVNPQDPWRLPLSQTAVPVGRPPVPADSFADIAHINDQRVAMLRASLFTAVQDLGINGWTNDPLPDVAARPGSAFADEPLEGSIVAVAP